MAGGSKLGEDSEMITEINVTPLVDIMLVLLIIFMLTANLIMAPSIKLELPKAATGEGTAPSTIALTLTKEGQLYLNGTVTTENDVRSAIPAALAKDAKTQAIIAADQTVPYGSVMHLLDLVRALGIENYALNIEPQPTQ